jgi:hypothetical protein
MHHVNATESRGTEALAVCRCDACHREWTVEVHLRPMPGNDGARERKRRERANA